MAAKKKPDPTPALIAGKPLMAEIGVSGLRQSGGRLDEEPLRELRGEKAVAVYKEMQTDPIVAAGLAHIRLLIRGAAWSVKAASADPADEESRDFVASCLDDMSESWPDTVEGFLSMLPYGWSYHEIVYKRRGGDAATPGESSAFDDGRIGWRKMPIRSQDTLDRWEFGADGGVTAMVQRDPNTYAEYVVPIEKALLFRPAAEKGSPEGKALLRGAYLPWYYKSNVQRFEGIGVERDLAGLPVARVPGKILAPTATPEEKAVAATYQTMVNEVRRNRRAGLVIQSDTFPEAPAVRMYDFELLTSGGTRQFNTDVLINRYNREIALAMLTDGMLVGHEKVGTQSLLTIKTADMIRAATTWLGSIASVVNRHGIPRLLALNPSLPGAAPSLVPAALTKESLLEFAQAWAALAGVGFNLSPDDEAYFRRETGMPAETEAGG